MTKTLRFITFMARSCQPFYDLRHWLFSIIAIALVVVGLVVWGQE